MALFDPPDHAEQLRHLAALLAEYDHVLATSNDDDAVGTAAGQVITGTRAYVTRMDPDVLEADGLDPIESHRLAALHPEPIADDWALLRSAYLRRGGVLVDHEEAPLLRWALNANPEPTSVALQSGRPGYMLTGLPSDLHRFADRLDESGAEWAAQVDDRSLGYDADLVAAADPICRALAARLRAEVPLS